MRYSLFPKKALSVFVLSLLGVAGPLIPGAACGQDFLSETPDTPEFENRKVTAVDIEYEKGAKTVNEDKLRTHMAVAPGRIFSQTVIDEDIRTLYASGLVDDVQFFVEEANGGVRVIVKVKTRPLIRGLAFEGNSKFTDEKLAGETKVTVGQILSDAEIMSATRNLQKYYEGYGYPDITVKSRLQKVNNVAGYADLIFLIGEGQKNEIRKIRFTGNRTFGNVELRDEMTTKQKGWFSFFTKSGRISDLVLDEDLEALKDFYQSNGYWRAEIGSPSRMSTSKGDAVDLVIPIEEGPRYFVNSVSFPNIKVFKRGELVPSLTLLPGKPYSSKAMRDDIRMIRSFYGSRGYADVSIVSDVREVTGFKVNVFYRITPGTRKKVGRVNIQGNTISQDRVIRREVPMVPGKNYNSVDLETTKRRLQNLGYFEDVQVTGSPSSRAGFRDLDILVREGRTGTFNVGFGFNSVESVVGRVTLEQRNFDIRNWGSFKGGGQRFSLSLQAGAQRTDFRVSLVEPWFMGRKLALGTDLYYRDIVFLSPEFDQTNIGAAVHLRKQVGTRSYVRGEYRIESVDVQAEDDTSQAFKDEDGEFLRSAVSLNYVYDSRDSNKLPTKGHKIDLGVTYAGGFLGGDVDTFKVSAAGTKHWKLRWNTILTARGSIVVVDSHGGNDNIPIFEREFLGGARDVRGFEFRDLGPRDNDGPNATGEVLGGASSLFGSLELTFPITDRVRGAVFYDMGIVNEDSWDFNTGELASDVGVGLRLDLPLGPLAIDYAIPVEIPDELADNGGQFNFYLNYQF